MNNFNYYVAKLLAEMATNTAASASTFGSAAAAAAANPAMQGDSIYNQNNALPVAPADLLLGKKNKKKKSKVKSIVQRRTLNSK